MEISFLFPFMAFMSPFFGISDKKAPSVSNFFTLTMAPIENTHFHKAHLEQTSVGKSSSARVSTVYSHTFRSRRCIFFFSFTSWHAKLFPHTLAYTMANAAANNKKPEKDYPRQSFRILIYSYNVVSVFVCISDVVNFMPAWI